MIFKQPWPSWLSFKKPLLPPTKNRRRHFKSSTLAFTWVEAFSIPQRARNSGPTSLTEELRYGLSERDLGALLLVANIAFWYFIKLPLGMAETKRFLHQGLFLSDFSSSLSLRSSVSPLEESLLGDDDDEWGAATKEVAPMAAAGGSSRSSFPGRRFQLGSLIGRRTEDTISELLLRTNLSG